MVVNGFRYGQCVHFGTDVLQVQLHFEWQNSRPICGRPPPVLPRVLCGANAMARMRRLAG